MIQAEIQRFLENPFIGEDWLPIAQSLLELHRSKNFSRVVFHTYSQRHLKAHNRGGPTLGVDYLSDGTVLMTASANNDIRPELSHQDFELMEALGFTVPRQNDGEYALVKDSQSADSNPRFYRLFESDVDPVVLVELTLTCFDMVYRVYPGCAHSFGYSQGQHEFVHGLGLLERYAITETNSKAAIFGLKGSHPSRALYKGSEESAHD